MDPHAALKLCGEYQSFCRNMSSVVSQQQAFLSTRMKAKEGHALEASRALQKHLQDVKQFELMFKEVEKIYLQINTTKQLLMQVITNAEEACSKLPQMYQLAPIRSFVIDRSQNPAQKNESTRDGDDTPGASNANEVLCQSPTPYDCPQHPGPYSVL